MKLEEKIVELEGRIDDERRRGAQARAALEAEIDHGQEAANELEAVIRLVLESRRYRLGDRLGNLVDRTRMRAPEPSAAEIADGIRERYHAWCRRQQERRATKPGSSD